MARLRIGFVGVGGMGQAAHLRNYASLSDCEVVALAELRSGLAAEVAKRYGVPRIYANHAQMLAKEELDGAVAIQPFDIHGRLVPELLDAGVPIITEKPLAASVEAGERILATQKRTGTPLYIAYHKRSDPATIAMKKKIGEWQTSGEVGKMRYIRISMPPGDWIQGGFNELIGSDEPYPALERDPAPEGMSKATAERYIAFVNYYIHQVNLLRHLLGGPYELTHADPAGVTLSAVGKGGVSCLIEMAPYNLTLDWQESALVCFERGWLKLELPAPVALNRPGKLTCFRDPGARETPEMSVPTLPMVHAMRQQAVHFLAALRGETTPLCGPADALEDLRIARRYIEMFEAK